MKAGSLAAWTVSLGVACVLATSGCCGPLGSGCRLGQCGVASKPARSEAAVVQRDSADVPPAKTVSEWMAMQRSDLP